MKSMNQENKLIPTLLRKDSSVYLFLLSAFYYLGIRHFLQQYLNLN
jgi:hypothetical protein